MGPISDDGPGHYNPDPSEGPWVGGVFHRMAVHDRVLRSDAERTTVATTKCTKGGCKLGGGRRMPEQLKPPITQEGTAWKVSLPAVLGKTRRTE